MGEATSAKTTQEPNSTAKSASGWLKRLLAGLALVVLAIAGYLLVWPSPIDPVPYNPPPLEPLAGPFAPNDRLTKVDILAAGKVNGPEDVEIDAAGRVFTGTVDGRIMRVDPDGAITTLTNTGGRPVGMAFAPDGNLIVADAVKGLISVDPAGKITTLATSAGDEPLGFADDVDVARDGKIYFSDASTKFGPNEYLYDMLEGRPHGRLVEYDPATRATKVLLGDLCFANGVALSQNEDFVLVNETYRYRIMRYWLKGERAGQSDIFVDNLPGYPDNITSNRRGTFWLALFTVRNAQADWLSPRPFLKGVMAKLPAFLWPQPAPYAFVVKIDEEGNVLDSFQDAKGNPLYSITSALEHDGYLYLGSLHNDRIGKYKLPESTEQATNSIVLRKGDELTAVLRQCRDLGLTPVEDQSAVALTGDCKMFRIGVWDEALFIVACKRPNEEGSTVERIFWDKSWENDHAKPKSERMYDHLAVSEVDLATIVKERGLGRCVDERQNQQYANPFGER